jgi:hypothetical protein
MTGVDDSDATNARDATGARGAGDAEDGPGTNGRVVA